MHRNYHCLEMVLLLLISHFKCNGPLSRVQNCSRSRSHIVHLVIQKKILPIFSQYKTFLPLSCPFHAARDVLWWPDVQKHHHDKQWVCPTCGKSFDEEHDLTHHMDEVHMQHASSQKEDSVCLASFCDIFRCDVLSLSFDSAKSNHSLSTGHLHSLSTSHLKSDLIIRDNRYCNENAMLLLQQKCKNVITQCLVEVLVAFSAKDFHDMEAELDAALCSYLTCQKYWDGSLTEVHRVPVLLCIILVVLMTGVFYVSYQTISLLLKCSPSVIENSFCNGYPYPDVTGVKFRPKSRVSSRKPKNYLPNHTR